MKYIFDFDDVLFHNTAKLKPHLYKVVAKAGIPEHEAREFYPKTTENFTIRNFLASLFSEKKIMADTEALYHEVMNEAKNFTNEDLLEFVKKAGKDNCYLVTHGALEHQQDKINRAGAADLFSKIYIVQGSKTEAIEEICEKNKDEKIVFIDDKAKHFENLDFKKYPNLETILYTGQTAEELKREIHN